MPQVRSEGALRALAPKPALLGAAEALRPLPGRAFAISACSLEDLKSGVLDRTRLNA